MGSQDLDTWFITMVSCKSPKDRIVGPLPNGRTPWLINEGDPNYLLSRMILHGFQSGVIHYWGEISHLQPGNVCPGCKAPSAKIMELYTIIA